MKGSKDKSGQLLLETAHEENKHISCCAADCSCNLDKRNTNSSTVSTLPSWLQKCTEENKRNTTSTKNQVCIYTLI